MALINCPECQKEISDKVKACPHCGYPFDAKPQQVEITSVKLNKNISPEKKKKRRIISIVAILCIISLIITGVLLNNARIAKEASLAEEARIAADNEYEKMFYVASYKMLMNAGVMETMINTVKTTWSNAIEDSGKDFNTEIANLYKKESFVKSLSTLDTFDGELESNVKKLQNPPQKFEKAYDEFIELYQTYQGLYNQAKSPTGSLLTYSEDTNKKIDDFLSRWNKIRVLLPDIEEKAIKYMEL